MVRGWPGPWRPVDLQRAVELRYRARHNLAMSDNRFYGDNLDVLRRHVKDESVDFENESQQIEPRRRKAQMSRVRNANG